MKGTKLIAGALVISLSGLLSIPVFAETQKPTVTDFQKTGYKNTTLTFAQADFSDHFTHEDYPTLVNVKFVTLPSDATEGVLKLSDAPITADQIVPIEQIDTLVFEPATDFTGDATFTWQGSNGTEYSESAATVTITIKDEAPPTDEPSESPTASPTEAPTESPEATESPEPTIQPLRYEDMLDHWGSYSAGMLGTQGIIVGEEVANRFYFHPEKLLTRIEYIIYVNGVFQVEPAEDLSQYPFADSDLPGYIRKQAMAAYEKGIIAGTLGDDGQLYLNPYEQLTRAECVTILDNALKVETPNEDPLDFADTNDIPEWAVQAVKNMEGYGIVRGYDDNTFRPWSNITKAQAAEMLYQSFKYQKLRALRNTMYVPTSFMQ